MRDIYRLDGGNGVNFFATRAEAERAAAAIPSNWGSAGGMGRPRITAVKLFDTVAEWQSYTGFGGSR